MTLPTYARTKVKICGLTREQDVDAAVAAGADAVGFVLYPLSPRYVSPARAAKLARRMPPFTTAVLLFANAEPADIASACQQVPGATLQFHGDENAHACWSASQATGRPYLRAARIPLGQQGRNFDLARYAHDHPHAQGLLLDAHVPGFGGAGQSFDWSLLPVHIPAHLVLSGGLHADNVGVGIRALRPRCTSLAVDVSSGVEACNAQGSPMKGIKDPAKIHQFMAAVRAADGLCAAQTQNVNET